MPQKESTPPQEIFLRKTKASQETSQETPQMCSC